MSTETQTKPTTPAGAPRATLSEATRVLFHIASRSHTLAEMFGVDRWPDDEQTQTITLFQIPRPWLSRHPKSGTTDLLMTFDADKFAARLNHCSDGQRYMMLFILNVWNPSYAKSKGWQFDLFKALGTLDEQNREAIAWWLKHPIWP